MNERSRVDFELAMAESFADHLCPPLPEDDASPQEMREVLIEILGDDVTPEMLASLSEEGVHELSLAFGDDFESPPPSGDQIRAAIATTLARWPVGSLGKSD